MIIVQGNGTIRTISVNKKLGAKAKRPKVLICYDLMEGLTNEEEDLIFETKPKLFLINTITISYETISLLSVGLSNIRINGEFEPQQGISYQGVLKLMASTTKTTKFNVKPKISLENKVYPKTYYHQSQVDIEVDETPTKI